MCFPRLWSRNLSMILYFHVWKKKMGWNDNCPIWQSVKNNVFFDKDDEFIIKEVLRKQIEREKKKKDFVAREVPIVEAIFFKKSVHKREIFREKGARTKQSRRWNSRRNKLEFLCSLNRAFKHRAIIKIHPTCVLFECEGVHWFVRQSTCDPLRPKMLMA